MKLLSLYLAIFCLINTPLAFSGTKDFSAVAPEVCVITSNPSNVSICIGNNTSFKVEASGAGLTYKWQVDVGFGFLDLKSSSTFSDVDKAELKVNSVSTLLNGYKFQCLVSNSCGAELVSETAALTVLTPPSINSNPSPTAVCQNSDAYFSIGTSGSSLTYQWQEDKNDGNGFLDIDVANTAFSGVKSNVLTVKSVTPSVNAYKYRCVVAGVCSGPITSGSAALTVNPLLAITSQPQTAFTCASIAEADRTVSYTVVAEGTNLTYQWQVDAGFGFVTPPTTPIHTGINSATLTVKNITGAFDGYIYRCIVTSSCGGSEISSTALLKINNLPAQPSDFTKKSDNIYAGAKDVEFSVPVVAGADSYDWTYKNSSGGVVPGVTIYGNGSNSVTVDFETYAESGTLSVCTANGCGISAPKALSVVVTPDPSVLPVDLISYSADLANGAANLKWSTTSESNNDYFLIEHSTNASDFKSVAKIQSKGNSNNLQSYSFVHTNLSAGNNYYRLVQFDKDGKSKDLGIKEVNYVLLSSNTYIYPNPLSGNILKIKFNTEERALPVSISNIYGQALFNKKVEVNNSLLEVELNEKPSPGIYIVTVDKQVIQKLIVN